MATLMKILRLTSASRPYLYHRQKFSTTTVFSAAAWNKDWKPGPIPRTPEERAAAAKKYGLRPEDYNCLVDGNQGDFPNLPLVARSWRDPFEDYDNPGQKRNYGEPVHVDNDIIGADLWDPNTDDRYTYWQYLLFFVLLTSGFVGTYILLEPYPMFLPEMPKQYPFNNLYLENGGDPAAEPDVKHYTFEPPCEEECD